MRISLVVVVCLCLPACGRVETPSATRGVVPRQRFEGRSIELFVGSASKPATEEAAALFERQTGATLVMHFGGSGQMLSQMKLTGRGDLYFPGSSDYMEMAKREGLVMPDTERTVVYLLPAINVAKGNPKNVRELDAPLRRQLQHDFHRLQRDLQLTVLHVTHDQEEAFLLADQVAVLMQGRVVQVAGTGELYARPNSIRVARFLGISNIWPVVAAQVSGSSLLCQMDGLRLEAALPQPLDSPPTHVGVAASEVELTESTCRCAGANRFSATVVSTLHLGHRRLIRLRLDGLHDRYLECSAAPVPSERCPWTEGAVVQVHIRPSSVRAFCEPAEGASPQKGKPHG